MRKGTFILVLFFVVNMLFAQAPEAFKYQAVARDAGGNVLANTSVSFKISLLSGSSTGTEVYSETHTTTTNNFGLANLEIGKGNIISGTMGAIDWASNIYFVKIELDITGGSNYQVMGTSQLLSVPYALHAKTVEQKFDADSTNELQNLNQVLTKGNDAGGNSTVNLGSVAIGTTTPAAGAALEVQSTTGTVLMPRMNTTQRDAITPQEGMMIYNTDVRKFQGYSLGTEHLDQNFDFAYTGGGSMGTKSFMTKDNLAQSFTAGVTEELTKVELFLNNEFSPGDSVYTIVIRILDGDGTSGSVLGQTSSTVVFHPSNYNTGRRGWYSFSFSGIPIISGNKYTIQLYSSSNMNKGPAWYYENQSGSQMSAGQPYTLGKLYKGTFINPNEDFGFRAYTKPKQWVDLH